jgi:hypothetical protein
MANNYTQFSFEAFTDLTEKESQWLADHIDEEKLEEAGFPAPFEDEYVGFDMILDNGSCIIIGDEAGDVEQVALFLQQFLQEFKRKDVITFCWADTCSKMRLDEFGGGGVYINAEKQVWINPVSMLNALIEGKDARPFEC